MGLFNRKDLLKKEALKIEKVDLGSENFVYVKQMTGRERDLFERSLMREIKTAKGSTYESATEDYRAKLAVNTVCDENGNMLLIPSDYPALSKNMGAVTLEKIVNAAQELNKITEEDKESLVKNSDAVLDGDSSLDSAES